MLWVNACCILHQIHHDCFNWSEIADENLPKCFLEFLNFCALRGNTRWQWMISVYHSDISILEYLPCCNYSNRCNSVASMCFLIHQSSGGLLWRQKVIALCYHAYNKDFVLTILMLIKNIITSYMTDKIKNIRIWNLYLQNTNQIKPI